MQPIRTLIVRHKFWPVTKEMHSDGDAVSYFLLTAVFNIPNKRIGIAKIDIVSMPKKSIFFIVDGVLVNVALQVPHNGTELSEGKAFKFLLVHCCSVAQ